MTIEFDNTPRLRTATALAEQVPELSTVLLALDFDGTLAPIVNEPADARLLPEAKEALLRLARHMTVAVLSGRPLNQLTPHFAGMAGLTLIGEHGRVWQDSNGHITNVCDVRALTAPLAQLYASLCTLLKDAPGWSIEQKPAGIAVHHRNVAPEQVALLRPAVLALLNATTNRSASFRVLQGHAVDELLPTTVSKGAALAKLCGDYAALTPIAMGDDVTDEDAFRIARAHAGHGILIATTARASVASFRLAEPIDVATFLTLLAARLS